MVRLQHLVRAQGLMDEGVGHVLYQSGGAGRLDAVPGDVAHQHCHLVTFHFEGVVEVAAHLGGLVAER